MDALYWMAPYNCQQMVRKSGANFFNHGIKVC